MSPGFSPSQGAYPNPMNDNFRGFFEQPYEKSYAVLVAIDDYKRLKDPKHRGPTGFGQLEKMVEYCRICRGPKKSLLEIGFPGENIVSLYEEYADSTAINNVLQTFWAGGQRSSADRVFFYFGSHGSARGNVGFLVTRKSRTDRESSSSAKGYSRIFNQIREGRVGVFQNC